MNLPDKEQDLLSNSDFFIDDELQLIIIEKTITSKPDDTIPVYRFQMINRFTKEDIGGITLKAGYTDNIVKYRGNIGFTVNEKFRGRNYAVRSCKLLIPLIKFLNLSPIYLTCDADNYASKKSIEKIGARFLEEMIIPDDSEFACYYPITSRKKLLFSWEVQY